MTGRNDPEALSVELHATLKDESRASLSALLRQSCHDLNNPLGTMGLELFSLDEVLQSAVQGMGPAAAEASAVELAELRTIVSNLSQAQKQLEQTVAVLQKFARSLS